MDQDTIIKDKSKAITSKTYKYELYHQLIEQIPLPSTSPSNDDYGTYLTRGNELLTKEDYTVNSFLTFWENPLKKPVRIFRREWWLRVARGDFYYYHYGCDGQRDHGWGCAYRTLQSMSSWILHKRQWNNDLHVPGIKEIQECLVRIEDKPKAFIGSRDWIGALEVFYVVDSLYDVPCKILHITRGEDLSNYCDQLMLYFKDFGGFVMMGGDMDAASKGIAGIHTNGKDSYLLVVDPHYSGVPTSIQDLINDGYIRWQNTKEFVDSSFYNLCLPYLK